MNRPSPGNEKQLWLRATLIFRLRKTSRSVGGVWQALGHKKGSVELDELKPSPSSGSRLLTFRVFGGEKMSRDFFLANTPSLTSPQRPLFSGFKATDVYNIRKSSGHYEKEKPLKLRGITDVGLGLRDPR